MKIRAALLIASLILMVITGCSSKKDTAEEKNGEQIAADYVQSLGYTILDRTGVTTKYTLERKTLENSGDMGLWGVQKKEPDAYFGKKIVAYLFIVKNHPLEKLYSPDDYNVSVMVMLAGGKVIGGASGPKSKIRNLVMAGGEYSIDGKTIEEVKGMEYSQWRDHWIEKYGKQQ